jgi:Type IV pilin-like G and H, putative
MLKFGLGAIGVLLVSSALTLPAIAKPAPNEVGAIKADVEMRMHTLAHYQSEYFSEHGRFATTFKDVIGQPAINGQPKLGAETKTFSYRVFPNPQAPNLTMIAAIPKQKNFPTLIALMVGKQKPGSERNGSTVATVICTSNEPETAVPRWPRIGKPNALTGFECPAGF